MTEWWQVGVAIYAAVVATGALFLEVRRWFEDRLRLRITPRSRQLLLNVAGQEGKTFLTVRVANVGARSTTITGFGLLEYRWRWFPLSRRRLAKSGLVLKPDVANSGMSLPYHLEPGKEWVGMAMRNEETASWIDSGRMHVGIYTSHREPPFVVRVRPDPPKASDSTSPRAAGGADLGSAGKST